MSPLLRIITLVVSIILPLLPVITIIIYYYVFESEQLADDRMQAGLRLLSGSTTIQPRLQLRTLILILTWI